MSNIHMEAQDEIRQTYMEAGVRLEIVASCEGENQWALMVVNEAGIRSHWIEFFATGDAALTAALQAIREEGVEAFSSVEGFDYLGD